MAKPRDFFIDAIDFFAVLLPGILLMLFFAGHGRISVDDKLFWPGVLAGGYIAGHLIHALGALLDPIFYDSIFQADSKARECPLLKGKRSELPNWWDRIWFDVYMYPHRAHQLAAYAAKLVSTTPAYRNGLPSTVFTTTDLECIGYNSERSDAKPSGIFQWARAWVRTQSPVATAEIDRLEADSKLFRSLAVALLPVAGMGWPPSSPPWPQAWSVALVLAPLCLWRYCDLRQKMVRMCYLYFVQLHYTTTPSNVAVTKSTL